MKAERNKNRLPEDIRPIDTDRFSQPPLPEFIQEADAIPVSFRLDHPEDRNTYLIGGKIQSWKGKITDVYSPLPLKESGLVHERRIGSTPALTAREAQAALDAALAAFDKGRGQWPATPPHLRAKAVEDFLARLAQKKKKIVTSLMWEIAKPYTELENEFDRTKDFAQAVIAEAMNNAGGNIKKSKGIIGLIRKEPLGVALCMGPYNYPLFETLSLVLPALLMGNTIIVKPPKFGVLFFFDILEDFRACFPQGAINVIFGDGETLIPPLMKTGLVDIFAFIGSCRTANQLLDLHPKKNRLQTLLGLEAKNAAVVLADADCRAAAREVLLGALAFNGQRCAALKIIFVHKDALPCFRESLLAEMPRIKTGMPWIRGVRITPLVDRQRIPYLAALVSDAVQHGARVVNKGGFRCFHSFFSPTILEPINSSMRIYHEEQFGPIIPIVPFEDVETPVQYVMNSKFGQQISLFGHAVQPLKQLAELLKCQVARVNINAKCQRGPDSFPFAGRKDSTKGDFSPRGVLESFSKQSTITLREGDPAEKLLQRLQDRKSTDLKKARL